MIQLIKLSVKLAILLGNLQVRVIKALYKLFFNKKSKKLEEIYKIQKTNPSKAGYEFELFVLDHFKKVGYTGDLAMSYKEKGQYPKLLKKTKGDGGMDIILENNKEIILIQTKFYSSNIKKEVVSVTRDVSDIFKKHFFEMGDKRQVHTYIVTNADFDNTAYAFAEHCSIKLINGAKLDKILNKVAA